MQRVNDEEAIRAAIRTFETGWNDHNMDVMFQAFLPDAEWINVVGMWWRGLEAVKLAHQAYHQTLFKHTPFRIADLHVRFVGRDAAIAIVQWSKGSFTPPDGRPRPPETDVMSLFLVKNKQRWLIAGGHNTTVDENAQPFNPIARAAGQG